MTKRMKNPTPSTSILSESVSLFTQKETAPNKIIIHFEDKNYKRKKKNRQINSLDELCKKFIKYVLESNTKTINLNTVAKNIRVKKRRIYDITNVLQGINYIQKSGKNEIVWTKTISNKSKSKKKLSKKKNNINKPKVNIEELEKKKNELDKDIDKFKAEFNSIAKKNDFEKFGYITTDDIKRLSINANVDIILIKATKGTVMNVIDKNDIQQAYDSTRNLIENNEMKANNSLLNLLNKSNQLAFSCPEGADTGINIYEINSGNIREIKTNKKESEPKKTEENISIAKFQPNINTTPQKLNLSNIPTPTFNKQNLFLYNNNNSNYPINSNIAEKKFPSNSERGNLETFQQSNFTANNKEPNIGVSYTSHQQKFSNYNYRNYNPIYNPNNINNNLKEEKFSFTTNVPNLNNK
jgi:hypothetical protein